MEYYNYWNVKNPDTRVSMGHIEYLKEDDIFVATRAEDKKVRKFEDWKKAGYWLTKGETILV